MVESRDRELGTKNGKPGQVSSDESVGLGIRVLAGWLLGFRRYRRSHAARAWNPRPRLAVGIARASALAKKHDVVLAPEDKYEATWVSPCRIDPFLGQRRRTALAAHWQSTTSCGALRASHWRRRP